MGFLGSLLSDALSSGIKKGLGNAIGKAVENIVKPSVDEFAQKHADTIDKASKSLDDSSKPVDLSYYVKICPECHEGCRADNAYCPSCGAAIGAGALKAAYTCRNCEYENKLGATHCVKCGWQLPAEDTVDRDIAEDDEKVLDEFIRVLPQYPVWRGGRDYTLEENGERDGHPTYCFTAAGGEHILYEYIAKLRAAGFQGLSNDEYSDLYFKVIDGNTYCFSCTDAITDDGVWVGFYVDNSVKAGSQTTSTPPPAQPDLGKLAQDVFKKFF